ncbi:hypothetical protein F3087_08215 [Nocardia colli]|uniref:Uncharacterized protein n=1 Tax=Nocardia colli TaxID=2545717 RepID=A0A5N0EJ08_9NOCA|nr:hypothetical protein [Nocardia colli]KAA8888973.1 hypothetical protein F3087_08215 [Nocardia colli]
MDSGEERDEREPSPRMTGWTVALTCVAIVAGGVIVGGLLHSREPELTTAPVVPSPITAQPEVDSSYVTPPVVYPVDIPGCAVVEPPSTGPSMSFVEAEPSGYDNPAYPWFSGPKAVAMSQALRDALPDAVDVGFAPVKESLLFDPIFDPTTDSGERDLGAGWTTAHGPLLRDGKPGQLMVSVKQSTAPIPPCVAGDLDERRRLADGTTVDVHDTWSESRGVRTLTRSAYAYLPDGTVATARATDDSMDGSSHSGTVPLSLDDLAAVATAAGLRVSTPVPPGTPDVPQSCHGGSDSGGTIDEAAAHRLDAVLARIPLDGLAFDRPLGQLRPSESGASGVCQAVQVTTQGRQSLLSVAIAVGQRVPETAASGSVGDRVQSRQLPDGAVVESRESRSTKYANEAGAQPIPETSRIVTVTRRSGTQIRVSSTAEGATEALPFDQLEAIATNPDLEVR